MNKLLFDLVRDVNLRRRRFPVSPGTCNWQSFEEPKMKFVDTLEVVRRELPSDFCQGERLLYFIVTSENIYFSGHGGYICMSTV